MPNNSRVADLILTALGDYLKRDTRSITPEHSLRDDLGLDSMAIIELLYKIEETFDLQIPDDDLKDMVTVGNVIAYVQEKVHPTASERDPKSPKKSKPANK